MNRREHEAQMREDWENGYPVCANCLQGTDIEPHHQPNGNIHFFCEWCKTENVYDTQHRTFEIYDPTRAQQLNLF